MSHALQSVAPDACPQCDDGANGMPLCERCRRAYAIEQATKAYERKSNLAFMDTLAVAAFHSDVTMTRKRIQRAENAFNASGRDIARALTAYLDETP